MGCFKLIRQDEVVCVVKDPAWVKQSVRGRITLCDVTEATGIMICDGSVIYHIAGTKDLMNGRYDDVFVVDIATSEYDKLSAVMELGGTIANDSIIWDEPAVQEPMIQNDVGLDEFKERYLQTLRTSCQSAIFNGVDVIMSDGTVRHFDLELEDQINLIALSAMVADGATTIPYHASGCLCEDFSTGDFSRIVDAANTHKNYHTTYYNSLKNWVMSMSSIADVCAVHYGDTVPEEYCSNVYLRLEGVKNS